MEPSNFNPPSLAITVNKTASYFICYYSMHINPESRLFSCSCKRPLTIPTPQNHASSTTPHTREPYLHSNPTLEIISSLPTYCGLPQGNVLYRSNLRPSIRLARAPHIQKFTPPPKTHVTTSQPTNSVLPHFMLISMIINLTDIIEKCSLRA